MTRLLFVLAFAAAAATAEDHAVHQLTSVPSDAQLVVTINPEARLSVVVGAPMPLPSPCGTATELKIKVINNGFVSAPLEAEIVGDDAARIGLRMDNTKLSGERQEARTLELISSGPDLIDVTIAFSIEHHFGDLAERDRVHVLLSCHPSSGAPS